MLIRLHIFLSLIFVVSCGMEVDEECMDAALNGQMMMINSANCGAAITQMEEYTSCGSHAKYLTTLASAYACEAGYNTTTFIVSDVAKFTGATGIGGLATFTTSPSMDSPTNEAYVNLWSAINILLYAGGIAATAQPSVANREDSFGDPDLADIHSLLSYLLMVQIGKYAYYYGNSDAAGTKGAGTGGNGCFANYDDPGATGFVFTLPGSCTTGGDGHPLMDLNVSIMCEGVVLMNAFLETLPAAINGFSGTEFASIPVGAFGAAQAALSAALGGPGSDDIAYELNYAQCVSDYTDVDTEADADLQLYFAMVYEAMFQ